MSNENTIEFIYGDLPKFKELYVKGKIKNIVNINDAIDYNLMNLGDLLHIYIEFILGQLGYTDIDQRFQYSEFKEKEWIEYALPLNDEIEWAGQMTIGADNSQVQLRDENGKITDIDILRKLPTEFSLKESKHITGSSIKKMIADMEEPNLIISHPILIDINDFTMLKEKIKEITGKDLLINALEFLTKIGVATHKISKMKNDWIDIRNKIIIEIRKQNPIIIMALNTKKIAKINEWLRKANSEIEQQNDYDNAISNCGKAVEAMLQILYLEYDKHQKLTFNELLNIQRQKLEEKFGSDILKDMTFIKDQRNMVVHPNDEQPTYQTAIKVLSKTELCYKLFNEEFLTISPAI